MTANIQNVIILTMAWILFKILVAADRCGIKDDLNLSARFWIFSCASGSTFTVYAICDLQQPKCKFTENDLILLWRLKRVFRCTRAHNLHQDARVSWMNQNKLTGSYMLRKIMRTRNKICRKHLLLAQNLARWPILIFSMHVPFTVALQM